MNENFYNQRPGYAPQPAVSTMPKKKNPFSFIFKRLFVFLLIVICIGVIGYLIVAYENHKNTLSDDMASAYSAVFLSTGQVYFGRIEMIDPNFLVLSSVYSVQTAVAGQNTSSSPSISLSKLTEQLHGPTDRMYIHLSSVTFYEHLRPDSKVVQSIESHQGQ